MAGPFGWYATRNYILLLTTPVRALTRTLDNNITRYNDIVIGRVVAGGRAQDYDRDTSHWPCFGFWPS